MAEKGHLTKEQRRKVWDVIGQGTDPADREPREVIKKDYNGDADAYLTVMARYHGILGNEDQT